MFTLLMNFLLWFSWSSGYLGVQPNAHTASRPVVSQTGGLQNLNFDPGKVEGIRGNGIALKHTIVLEDDTHFRPYFEFKK